MPLPRARMRRPARRALLATAFVLGVLAGIVHPARVFADLTVSGRLDVAGRVPYTDVHAWMDPDTGIPYALVGNNATGLHIVDVSDPAAPVAVSVVTDAPRFDVKTFGHYAYAVDGNYGFAGADGAIIDLDDPASPVIVGSFRAGHNVFVDADGYLYVTYPGLTMYDLNADPTQPAFVWQFITNDGHDVCVVDRVLYDFHGFLGTFIWDVRDHAAPAFLGSITDTSIVFHHSGWPTADGRHLFLCDEMSTHPAPDISVWRLDPPQAPVRVGGVADASATVHNVYVVGDWLVAAYYTAGLRVFDVRNPAMPVLTAQWDTSPLEGEGIFEGAWGCDPFLGLDRILVNDRPTGLWVFDFEPPSVTSATPTPHARVRLGAPWPNPGTGTVRVSFTLAAAGHVRLDVFDVRGRRVRTLVDARRDAGRHDVAWDGRDAGGRPAPSGVYFVRLEALGQQRHARLVRVR